MAEQSTTSGTTGSTSQSSSNTPAKSKVTILPSTEDGVLQPDAMRGFEHMLKDLDVEDLEDQRRQKSK